MLQVRNRRSVLNEFFKREQSVPNVQDLKLRFPDTEYTYHLADFDL